ncbi:MAG TPA: hypothetical protein PKV73_11040 [Agriterribacter sp.]|nr:hypothetical protein [Agriterribacter sp.]
MRTGVLPRVFLICIGIFLAASTTLHAQPKGNSYKTALGVKFYPGAVTVKHFIKKDAALEGLLYFWEDGFRITGLYEFHGNINGAPGLKWYAGFGVHAGFADDGYWDHDDDDYYDHHRRDHDFYFGPDGVLGLDYKFKGAPINLSLDWQPAVNFGNDGRHFHTYYSGLGGFAIRYTFK